MYAYSDNERTENLSIWVQNHIEYIVVGILMVFYLFISNYFAWGPTFVTGGGIAVFPTSGGSDPYYNWMNIVYFITYHHWIVFDPRMNYPVGTINPRNPFFHMLVIVIAETFGPIFHVGVETVAFYAFEELDAIFGAIMIIPVYLIGKEIFGRRGGLIGAFLFAIMSVNLSAGVLSDARMHTPELLFALFVIYFYIKAMKATKPTYLVDKLSNVRSLGPNLVSFYKNNRVAVVYVMLAGASLGGLMLSWQGYAYIEAIILIYVAVQILANLIIKKPSGYLTFYTIIFIAIGFAMGAYYYQILGEGPQWYNTELILGIIIIGFAVLMNLISRRPWILIIPALVLAAALAIIGIAHFYPSLLVKVLGGYGYFIKSRVYTTIAEASGVTISSLGSYISGYGGAEFILGLSGLGYVIYKFLKTRSELMLFFAIFSIVSIFMSFESFKFNIDVAPVYAILSAGLLVYFIGIVKLQDLKKRRVSSEMSPAKSIKGNIKGLQVAFVVIVVIALVVPSGLSTVSSGIPTNNAGHVNSELASALPSFFGLNASTIAFAGASGLSIVNKTDPQVQSFLWLAGQDKNVPFDKRPAYLSWWDYGFQEMYQGRHPTVADDFQQGYEVAGQVLLAQNQSQILSLYIARVIQGNYVNNSNDFSSNVKNTLIQYLGNAEYKNVLGASQNPGGYTSIVLSDPSLYGDFIPQITSANVYFAYLNGQLSSKYSLQTLTDLYQQLISETGYNIEYNQITVGSSGLFPISASDPGIFYAPAYLTDYQSYNYEGEIVPYPFYNIIASTSNGTYPLNETPKDATITGTNISYTQNFYNSSIYRFTIGYPPSAVGLTSGIPGVSTGNSSYPVMPAWNMSNFEIVYSSSYYNPYKDYQNHLSAGKYIPLDQAYKLYKENNGTVVLFPPAVDLVSVNNEWNPIVSYYPGATVQGKVISGDGKPAPGVYVTLFDQYGIPHEVVKTNASGEYRLAAVPGNDTLLFSTGNYNTLELSGSSTIASYSLNVSNSQAERTDVSVNVTTGLPGYYIVKNLTLPEDSVRGNVGIAYSSSNSSSAAIPVNSGTLILKNSTYNNSFNVTISNGYFEKLNVPPETYNVSLVSAGYHYHNIGNISVVANSTTTKNITVNLDLILAKISIGSIGISGIPLKITTSNGLIIKQVTSNSNGIASAWVTPGNYSVSAGNLSITSMVRHVSFLKWGENDTSAYSLSPAVNVVISPGISGNINLELLKNGKMDANITAERSSNGSFVANVPIGVYTIYATNSNYSYLRTVDIKTNSSFNLAGKWQKSSFVNLSSHSPGVSTAYVGDYEIMNSSALISYSFTSSVPLTVQIPIGMYSFSVLASTANGTMYGNVVNSVGPFAKISILAVKSNYVNVTATNLMSSSNYTATPSGLVVLYSPSGFPVSFGNLSSGVFSLLYPGISISGMYIRYISSSFHSQEINVESRLVSFRANPITMPGSLHFIDAKVTPNGARVTLYNSGANFSATIQNNNITFNLVSYGIPVGVYYVTVNGTKSGFLVDNSVIGINTGETSLFDRVLSNFGSVKANGSVTTNIYYTNGTEVISPQHLNFGQYYVYAYSSTAGVNISLVNVNGFLSFSPKYMPYAQLNLSNTLGNGQGTYLLVGNGFSITLSSGSTPVPLGYYSVIYHGTLANSTGSYSLTGSIQVSVTKNTFLSVPVSAKPLFTTVNGVLSFNGIVSSSSTVVFYSPDYTVTATTNIAGQYSVSLPTLNYTVYVQDSSLGAAFLQKLTVSPFANNLNYNISMQPAYRVKVYVALGTSTINNNVTLSTNLGDNYTFNSSVVSLLLPYGTYSFTTTLSSSMVAANDSYISVSYSASSTTLINSPSSVFLNMQIIPKTSFKFTPEQHKPNITPKVPFSYKFAIQNTGNVPEFIKLTSGATTWSAAFNTSVMNLQPGQSANVTGNFTDIGNVAYGNNSIPISVTYPNATKSYTLPVFVNKSLSYSVHKSAESMVGGKLDLPVVLNNTGNAEITLNFKIIDPTYITNRSWIPSLEINNITSNSTTVGYDSSTVLNVMLTSNNTAAVYNFNFNIEIYNKTVGYQNQTLSVVHLSSIQVGSHVTGNKIISNYTADPYESLYIGLIVIAVAVVGGLIVTIMRGRKR